MRFLLSFITCLLVVNLSFSQEGAVDSSLVISRISPVHTKAEALERASLFTGFQDKMATKSLSENDVQLITLVDTTTPFLADSINGRVAWQIDFKNVILDLKRTLEEDELKNPRNFEVLIDSINGQLLEIQSRYAGNNDSLARYPTSDESTRQLSGIGERYHGFPDVPPAITFFEALDNCKFYPMLAKEIFGSYILHTYCRNSVPTPVWIIYLRGMPPLPSHGNVPNYKATNMRFVVDAISGDVLYATNMPYPDLEKDSD